MHAGDSILNKNLAKLVDSHFWNWNLSNTLFLVCKLVALDIPFKRGTNCFVEVFDVQSTYSTLLNIGQKRKLMPPVNNFEIGVCVCAI
jgi:hypothetical protein